MNMIKVRTKETEEEYILLGAGFGMDVTAGRSIFSTSDGKEKVVALCDESGEIVWAKSKDVVVIEVDGLSVEKHFE